MKKKHPFSGSNHPNSPTYDPSLPIGNFPQLASYHEDDTEDFYDDKDDEHIPDEAGFEIGDSGDEQEEGKNDYPKHEPNTDF